MGSFLKKLANLFSAPPSGGNWLDVAVRCNRCGEVIHSRINMSNDLSIEYGETEGDISYYCRKLLIGEERCFQQIELELTFDRNRKLTDRRVKGGAFVDEKST